MRHTLTCLVAACLMVAGTSHSQSQQISGYVYDFESNKPLSGVNIFIGGTEPGTTSNADGLFKLKIKEFPVQLVFSHVGYNPGRVDLKSANQPTLRIYLKPETRQIGEVTISGERITSLIKGDTLNVVDYEIMDDQIVMLANPYKHTGDQRLYLTTLEGDTLSSRPVIGAGALVDVPESIDYNTRLYLFRDCFKNVQLLTSEAVYQVYRQDNHLYLIYPIRVEDFQSSLLPAKAILNGNLFTQKTTLVKNSTYVKSEGSPQEKLVKSVSDRYGARRYVRPIDFPDGLKPASWYLMRKGSYERCVGAPVIQRKNDIIIFDFFGNTIDFFSAEGDLLRSVSIKFHLMEYTDLLIYKHTDIDMINFSQKILYDEREDRIWAVWHRKSTGRYSLKEINPDNGEIVREIEVPDYPFVDRMRVFGNTLYFLYSKKTYPFYRCLYKMVL